MELILKLLYEYKKTIVTMLTGAVVYFLSPLVGEFFTPEIATAIETILMLVVTLLVGRYTRLSTTDSLQLRILNDEKK